MENTHLLDMIAVGLAITILFGGFLMMFTNFWTRKNPK